MTRHEMIQDYLDRLAEHLREKGYPEAEIEKETDGEGERLTENHLDQDTDE